MAAVPFLVMFGYVPFCFFAFWRWPPRRAAMIVMFGGALYLPANFFGIDPPVLPPLTKELWCPFWALTACLVMNRHALKARMFRGPEALVLVMVVGAVGTWLTNTDPIVHGPMVLPAITAYDVLADVMTLSIAWFPAFYLGRALFRSEQDLEELMRFMVIAALIYTIPIFYELRFSPQLHTRIYGYFPSQFDQVFRMGGYRPVVFFIHGLNLALSMTVFTLCAGILHRARGKVGRFWTAGRAFIYLLVVMVLCKSTGAYFHLAIAVPLLMFTGPKWQARAALGLATLMLTYPLLRLFELIPVDGIYELMAALTNEERALSLWFRLFTEGQILENTRDRILFGWGGYARSTEFDEITGEPLSILDGYWTAELGQHGLIGWGAVFGMMLYPTISAARAVRHVDSAKARRLLAGCAFICALYVFDWLPNSSISMDLTFVCGALAGCAAGIVATEKQRKAALRRARTEAARVKRASDPPPAGEAPR